MRYYYLFLKRHPSLENLLSNIFANLKLFVVASSFEFVGDVILFADFFEFPVSFLFFLRFCRSGVFGLENFDLKLSSLRLICGLLLQM